MVEAKNEIIMPKKSEKAKIAIVKIKTNKTLYYRGLDGQDYQDTNDLRRANQTWREQRLVKK